MRGASVRAVWLSTIRILIRSHPRVVHAGDRGADQDAAAGESARAPDTAVGENQSHARREDRGYAIAGEVREAYDSPRPLMIAIFGKWYRPGDRLLAMGCSFDHFLE
jgi:hypothetical protein